MNLGEEVRCIPEFAYELLVASGTTSSELAYELTRRGLDFAAVKVPAGHINFHLTAEAASYAVGWSSMAHPYKLIESDRPGKVVKHGKT